MTLKCPICKKDVALGEPDFPFCSERCRLVDLGRWASEEYRIPVVAEPAQPEIDEDDE